jgi:hypothetical protein
MSLIIIVQEDLCMSKTKMRCITCNKWFQSANAKEVTCPECMQKARKEKLATKNAPSINSITLKPKQTQGGTNQWLDKLEDVKVAQPDQPPVRPKIPSPPVQRDTRSRSGDFRSNPTHIGSPTPHQEQQRGIGPTRGPYTYRGGNGPMRPPGPRPRLPMGNGQGRGPYKPAYPDKPRGGLKGKPKIPRPKREKIPPPPPFAPTPEQLQQVEERYLELAQPAEFDGIRTQIAQELGIPKKAVKKIVKELRARQNIPSWWELQTYKGSTEELAKIKSMYEPYLPVPHINVHKKIAEELSLKPSSVYQAIKVIRHEMNLPPYNDPVLHAEEFVQLKKGGQTPDTEQSTTLTEVRSALAES